MENTTTSAFSREDVKAALRQMALKGCRTQDLIQLIRDRLRLKDENVISVLGYLCRTFDTQLPVVLPLREFLDCNDEEEPFLRALRICFWFSANIRYESATLETWDWGEFRKRFVGLQSDSLENWGSGNGYSVRGCMSEHFRDSVYARGQWETSQLKHPATVLADDAVLTGIRDFASVWREQLLDLGRTRQSGCRLGFSFEIQDQGSSYQVVACVEAMLDHVSRTARPAHVVLR